MSEHSPEADPVTLEVMRADRRFPMLPDASHSPPHNRIRELHVQPTEETLPERLTQAISQGLAWHASPFAENPDREIVVGAYVNSLKQLAGFRNDVEALIMETCRANLEFRQDTGELYAEARDAILKSKLKEMMDQAFSGWMPAKNIVTADLLSRTADVYIPRLNASLTHEAMNFSRQLFDMLQRMVDLELFGLVEWLPKQCCRYHFFRRVVIQGAAEETQTVTETLTRDESGARPRGSGRRVIGNRRTTSTHSIKHQIRFARHQHELINAVRTSVHNSTVIMPPQIVRLVESIPEWLYPFVEVIDGQIVRELIIERDVSVKDWTQVDVRDEPILELDPGIVIGPYVLSGWGSVEIQKEQQRRQAIEQAGTLRFQQSLTPLLIAAAIGLSGSALWLQWRWMLGHGGLLFVLLTNAAVVAAIWQAFENRAFGRRFAAPQHYAYGMTISLALLLLTAEWGVAVMFISLSWMTPVMLMATAFLSYHIAQLFR